MEWSVGSFRIDLCPTDPLQCDDGVDVVKVGRLSYIGWKMCSEVRTLTRIEPKEEKSGKNELGRGQSTYSIRGHASYP
jgi:hypothetical protein